MITIRTKIPYLAITFKEVLNVDTILNLKEGLGMMGMRFKGKPSKAQIVKMYDEYVKANPEDVLRCLRPDELTWMDNILKQGKGGYVTAKGIEFYNQLQKLNLVVSYEDKKANTTDIYLIDELHAVFAPHIDYVISNPVDYSTDKSMKTPLDATLYEVSFKNREILAHVKKWADGNRLDDMSNKELDRFIDALYEYEEVLNEYEGKIISLISATPQGFADRQKDIDAVMKDVRFVYDGIIEIQDMLEEVREKESSDEEYIDPEDKAQLEKLFNSKAVKDTIDISLLFSRHASVAIVMPVLYEYADTMSGLRPFS